MVCSLFLNESLHSVYQYPITVFSADNVLLKITAQFTDLHYVCNSKRQNDIFLKNNIQL